MSKNHEKTLEKLFSHPLNMNLEWREVKHLLESLGAQIDTTHHSHIKVKIGNNSRTFKTFHTTLADKHEIIELQHLLKESGFAPK